MSDADRHQNLDTQNLVVSRVLDAPVETAKTKTPDKLSL